MGMQKRPRQATFVARVRKAAAEDGNSLGIAPTGFGKTIVMAAIAHEEIEECRQAIEAARAADPELDEKAMRAPRVLVLQHRDELVSQNAKKFTRYTKDQGADYALGYMTGAVKRPRGDAIFAMVQTLARAGNLERLPRIGTVLIDETHHVAANTYGSILAYVRERNPGVRIIGVTATPERGDKRGYEGVFTNVGDQVRMGELIAAGLLVPPRTYIVDLGKGDEMEAVRRTSSGEYDMAEIEALLDTEVVNAEVIRHWNEKAADEVNGGHRRTIAFCSTVKHAADVAEAFRNAGVPADYVDGNDAARRKRVLAQFEAGEITVLCNVFLLTEGYDEQRVGAILLLRPSSYKGTFCQMVGRGLRTVDPELHPHFSKRDCIVLDFGTSSRKHGTLECEARLETRHSSGEAPTKVCPECAFKVPLSVMVCPNCGHEWEEHEREKDTLERVEMTEIDILNASRFYWCELTADCVLACGKEAWVGLFLVGEDWHAVGCIANGKKLRHLAVGPRVVALAAGDDFLAEHENGDMALKVKGRIHHPATQKQRDILVELGVDPAQAAMPMSSYYASCWICLRKQRYRINPFLLEQLEGIDPSIVRPERPVYTPPPRAAD